MESNEIRKAVSAHVTVAMFDFAKHLSGVGRAFANGSPASPNGWPKSFLVFCLDAQFG